MAPLSPLTVPNSPTHSSRCAPESDTATVSYSLNAAITRSSMALHPDLLDKHLLLLSRPAILNPLLAFPMYVRYTLLHIRGKPPVLAQREVRRGRVIATDQSRAQIVWKIPGSCLDSNGSSVTPALHLILSPFVLTATTSSLVASKRLQTILWRRYTWWSPFIWKYGRKVSRFKVDRRISVKDVDKSISCVVLLQRLAKGGVPIAA